MEGEPVKDILVVDDENMFLADLADYLSMHYGISHVVTAVNGKLALEMLRTAQFDLVVTDLSMPVMDGFSLLKAIQEKYPKMPALVMTSRNGDELEGGLRSLGVKRLFEKPLDFAGMARTILAMEHEAGKPWV
jgi:two-component system chemotaxis response regulator CheY